MIPSTCKSLRFLTILISAVVCATADTIKYPKSITLSYEIIGSSASVKSLATVSYDPKTLNYTLDSWTPPSLDILKSTSSEPTTSKLLRILIPSGSSTVTSLDAFDKSLSQYINLLLSPDGDETIFSASVTSKTPPPLTPEEERIQKKIDRAIAKGKPIPKPTLNTKKAKKEYEEQQAAMAAKKPSVYVNLVAPSAGPAPKLGSRKPPQLDAQGKEIPEGNEQPEKTFLQKYWWVFLVAMIFSMVGGGGGDGK